MIEVEIQHIASSRDGSPERFLILRSKDRSDQRVCPIIIGYNEAVAIAAAKKEQLPPRPMTHDLLLNMITGLGGVVQHIYIRELEESTFFADVVIKQGEELIAIDARPSDSIALATRAKAPIYVSEEILERVNRDLRGRRSDEEAKGSRRRSARRLDEASTPVTPEEKEKLSAYSDFLETLSLDDDADDSGRGDATQ